jgi:hypothetical protein
MTALICKTARRTGACVAATSGVLVLSACGHGYNPLAKAHTATSRTASGPAVCREAVATALGQVARRIYAEAQSGPNAVAYARMVAGSRPLLAAVARGDAAATRAALLPVLARQVVHVRVTRGQTVLADVGKPDALAPVAGELRDSSGRVVGAYTLAVQDDRAYVQVLHGISGAEVLLRSGGRQILGTLPLGTAVSIPARGELSYGGRLYEALSFEATAFPSGPLQIAVLVAPPQPGACSGSRAATIADTLGAVGRRIADGEVSSRKVALTIRRMQSSTLFRRAVARSDRAATLQAIKGFFRLHQFHIVRARVLRRGRVLADLGGPDVLGPARAVLLRDRAGRPTATFLVAVQDDVGYVKLAQRFVGADVVMRRGSQVVASTLNQPPTSPLPSRGQVTLAGTAYRVYTFTGTAFPTGSLNISLLFPAN